MLLTETGNVIILRLLQSLKAAYPTFVIDFGREIEVNAEQPLKVSSFRLVMVSGISIDESFSQL